MTTRATHYLYVFGPDEQITPIRLRIPCGYNTSVTRPPSLLSRYVSTSPEYVTCPTCRLYLESIL